MSNHPPHSPSWKRIHRSPFFWVAALFIMVAMIIYVTTDNLSMTPGKAAQPEVPVLTP